MRTLFLVLAVGLLALAAAPQNALACHKETPHGAVISCDGGGNGGIDGMIVFVTSDTYDGALKPDPDLCDEGDEGVEFIIKAAHLPLSLTIGHVMRDDSGQALPRRP